MSGDPAVRLPDEIELLAAFRGEIGWRPGDPLVCRWAMSIMQLHRVLAIRPDRVELVARRRADLILLIDQWVHVHIIGPEIPARPVPSLGAAVDEMAGAAKVAELQLVCPDPVSDEAMHAAWSRLGYLGVRWADLVTQVVTGQPPVPRLVELQQGR